MSGGDFERAWCCIVGEHGRTDLVARAEQLELDFGRVERPAQDSEAAIHHATEDALLYKANQHMASYLRRLRRGGNDDATMLAIALGLLMIILIAITRQERMSSSTFLELAHACYWSAFRDEE